MKGRILVTGAAGFVGRHLVTWLAQMGWRVTALARDPASIPAAAGVDVAPMPDLSEPVDWQPLLDGISHIVHLAGLAHATETIPEARYQRVNALAAGELAKAAAGRTQRLVFVSSVRAQSGPSSSLVLNEAMLPTPTDAYGRSKLAGERLVAQAGGAFTILRPTLVYGPGVKGNMAALARLARSPLPLPFGALVSRRSLLDIEGLAAAIELALTSPEAVGQTLLAADPVPVTLRDLITLMRRAIGRQPGLVPLPPPLLTGPLRILGKQSLISRLTENLVVDTARLQAIGWQPPRTTTAAVAAMMRETS